MLLGGVGEGTTLMCFIARARDTGTVRTRDRRTFVLEPNKRSDIAGLLLILSLQCE